MCGRYNIIADSEAIIDAFDILANLTAGLEARYNVAPSQMVPVVYQNEQQRRLQNMHWGLIPAWIKDAVKSPKPINARAETIQEKPMFRAAFKHRRCIIPASGYYEWQKCADKKQPHHIYAKDKSVLAFAGLWEQHAQHELSCTIITTEANKDVFDIHHRMPVMIFKDQFSTWLQGEVEIAAQLLNPPPAGLLQHTAVSTWVNNPRNDSEKCIAPV